MANLITSMFNPAGDILAGLIEANDVEMLAV